MLYIYCYKTVWNIVYKIVENIFKYSLIENMRTLKWKFKDGNVSNKVRKDCSASAFTIECNMYAKVTDNAAIAKVLNGMK